MYIVPTIDTEGVHGEDPFVQMALGNTGEGQRFGALKIAEIFNRYDLSATFFVDVYEHTLFGEDPLKKLCNDLLSLNQDVQLHTHPSWCDDRRDFRNIRKLKKEKCFFPQHKNFMHKCSFDEQVEILLHGITCLEKWIGKKPIAHRSGGYGLNRDTISALRETGIPVDSSMHHNHVNSKITWSMNRVVEKDGVIELPVTGFRRRQTISGFGLKTIREVPFLKTDLDFCSLEELLWFLSEAKKNGLKVMNLFMHSYSLLRFDDTFKWFRADALALRKLEGFITSVLRQSNASFLSISEFYRRYMDDPCVFQGPDNLPERYARKNASDFATRKLRETLYSYYQRLRCFAKKDGSQ